MKQETAITYLESKNTPHFKLGLEQIKGLMKALGSPDRNLKMIHIAGTNGKGSVSQMMGSMLKEAGYRVGSFNSPHLITLLECIKLDGENIQEVELEYYVARLKSILEQLALQGIEPSYFEILTALALWIFKDKGMDFVILEVGLGGMQDATNVIETSLMSIITKIAIDHKDFLGNTLAEIAEQKAGIIKKNGLVVTPHQEKTVGTVLEAVCRKQDAKLYVAASDEIREVTVSEQGTQFKLQDEIYKLQLLGTHQAYNASIALKAIEVLEGQGHVKMTQSQKKQGLFKTTWAGRFEKISESPLIFIDGAHNVDGMMALGETLEALPKRYRVGVIGILGDKEVDEMLPLFLPYFDELIITEPNNPRAMPAAVLFEKVSKQHQKVTLAGSPQEALEVAMNKMKAEPEGSVMVFGSLYLIGEIREWVMKQFS